MNRRALIMTAVLVCVAPFAAATPARAHKFYASLAQVEYNAETGTVEVSLRVFADDLELALTRRAGREVKLGRTKDSDRLVAEYLREKFELKNRAGETKELRLVGVEVEREEAWLYFEAEMPEGLAGARLRDHVLFELFAKQVNVVDFKWTGGKSDLVFVRGDGERAVPEIKTGRR
ncbi:MAG TPA: DUF6702 family protein [Pyrinomonadaceae bacterium]|jgi:hypothetical protein|nr:DUF6702 family protein [Pyrinomonadaceae bacterium]